MTEGSNVFSKGQSEVVSLVSDVENIPSMRRCGYVGFLLSASPFAPFLFLSVDRTCVSRTGYKRRARYYKPQITPPPTVSPRALAATRMCQAKTAGLHPWLRAPSAGIPSSRPPPREWNDPGFRDKLGRRILTVVRQTTIGTR